MAKKLFRVMLITIMAAFGLGSCGSGSQTGGSQTGGSHTGIPTPSVPATQWVYRTPSTPTGDLGTIGVSPNFSYDRTIFVGGRDAINGGSGALRKSTDGGRTWTTLYRGHYGDIADIEFSPAFATDRTMFVLHATGGYQLLKSTDGGTSWLTAYDTWAWDAAVSPNFPNDHLVFVLGSPSGFKSNDDGSTWQDAGFPNSERVVLSPSFASDTTMFLGSWNGVHRSTDGGVTWTVASNGLPYNSNVGTSIDSIAISPSYRIDKTVLVAVFGAGLFRSTDGGDSWSRVKSYQWRTPAKGVAFSPDYEHDGTIFLLAWSDLFKSTDGGKSWVPVPNTGRRTSGSRLKALAVSPDYKDDHTVFVSASDGLYAITVAAN